MPLRVYGGEDADEETYAYVVRLEIKYTITSEDNSVTIEHHHLCTSSALKSTWALTAAHCFSYLSMNLVIRYGSVHSSPFMKNTFSDVISILPHPMYANSKYELQRGNLKNDIGLLKTTPMLVKSYAKLSAVDFHTMYGHEAYLGGFGVTTKTLPNGTIITDTTLVLGKQLQIFKVALIKCNGMGGRNDMGLVPGLCLASRCNSLAFTCGGDSGGPLIHTSGVVGVLSQGEASGYCLEDEAKRPVYQPGIVNPVSPYIEWINSYVRA